MNEMKGFYSDQFGAIRAVNIDGEPWFNATDITTALGTETRGMRLQST